MNLPRRRVLREWGNRMRNKDEKLPERTRLRLRKRMVVCVSAELCSFYLQFGRQCQQ